VLILSGGYDAVRAESDLEAGKADLIAVGRPLLANPDLVRRWKTGAPVNPPDMERSYTPGAKRATPTIRCWPRSRVGITVRLPLRGESEDACTKQPSCVQGAGLRNFAPADLRLRSLALRLMLRIGVSCKRNAMILFVADGNTS
jgi:hypothetical protein